MLWIPAAIPSWMVWHAFGCRFGCFKAHLLAQCLNWHFWYTKFLACFSHRLTYASCTFHILSWHMRSTSTVAFIQTFSFYKLFIPTVFVIFIWWSFIEPCMKLMLCCNNRPITSKWNIQGFSCCNTILETSAISMKSLLTQMYQKLGQTFVADSVYWIHVK